jgi:hypothetical protein
LAGGAETGLVLFYFLINKKRYEKEIKQTKTETKKKSAFKIPTGFGGSSSCLSEFSILSFVFVSFTEAANVTVG